jgi:hypothetical protein
MNYMTFQSRAIALFLQRQRSCHRKMLSQCDLSLQGGELIIKCSDKLATRALWLRRSHLAKAAPKLGITLIRFK